MRIRDLLSQMVPAEKLGEAQFAALHEQCRAVCGLPNGADVGELTRGQQDTIVALVTPVQRELLKKCKNA